MEPDRNEIRTRLAPRVSYEDACACAATAQGLDPIADVLRAAGIPFTIDQTGGFTMCIRVPMTEDGRQFVYVTAGDVLDDYSLDGPISVGRYWECDSDEMPCYEDDEQWGGDVMVDGLPAFLRDQMKLVPCPVHDVNPFCTEKSVGDGDAGEGWLQ
jgi:hypothetical protein